MMSQRQRWLYWREVKAAQTVAMRGRETFTKHEENEWRHGVHIRALGRDKSHLEFTNRDLDRVLAELRAISDPGNLNAQLRQINQEAFRLRYGIRQEAREIAGPLGADSYIRGIIKRMHSEGRLFLNSSFLTHPSLEDLGPEELRKVRIALTQHERRTAGRVYDLKPA